MRAAFWRRDHEVVLCLTSIMLQEGYGPARPMNPEEVYAGGINNRRRDYESVCICSLLRWPLHLA